MFRTSGVLRLNKLVTFFFSNRSRVESRMHLSVRKFAFSVTKNKCEWKWKMAKPEPGFLRVVVAVWYGLRQNKY